ncbi:MAG: DEAD/DEAH box helicase [Actinomadura sp.]
MPTGEQAELPTVVAAGARARRKMVAGDVPCRLLTVRTAVRVLAALERPDAWSAWSRPSDSLLAWSVAAKLALEHVAAGHVVPAVRPAGPGLGVAYWRLAATGDDRLGRLAEAFPPAAHGLLRDEDDDAVWSAAELLTAFCDAVADACARTAGPGASAERTAQAARDVPFDQAWVAALSGSDPLVELPEEAAAVELARWAAPVAERGGAAEVRLCVQLHTPRRDEPDAPWPLDYLLQAADDPSLVVPAEEVWQSTESKMRVLGRQMGDPQEAMVRGLAEAARLFPPIDASLSERSPATLELDTAQAADFLGQGAQALSSAGLGVLLPAELTAQGARKLRARLRVGQGVPDPGAGITGAGLHAENLRRFRWEAAIGDEVISAEEFAEIVARKQPLVLWKGQWVRLDAGEMPRMAKLVGTSGELSGTEALAAALIGTTETGDLGEVEVVADGVLADLVDRLRGSAGAREPRLDGIEATLRGYQRNGVAWLQAMADLGLGALLADDMGLGKTLQTISLLAGRSGDRPHLVVCPTSVVGNWERELDRFAPDLPVVRHHGPERPAEADEFKAGAVTITSYGLLRRDLTLLESVDWDVVVLDEAQQIKNYAAQAARAARRLRAGARVALTGTPVENRLSELWSIIEFTNPGLLGRFDGFKDRFAIPVERWRDPEATARLRSLTAPFMLRRLKSDPSIAADLPAKQEATVACTLTREQATLYQATVRTLLDEEGLGSGIERRGRILKLLTALKQICNHPAQYLGESGPLRGRSGKLARTTEMLAEVVEAGDRALIFTQYREMGDLLARHLAASLRLPRVPFLHGGVPRTKRDQMVDEFQVDESASPLLIVSLKAGGTGLNLTRATHVVHYDRWWNPAVEDQATDRAYRIGQTRTVNVHKLVTGGTLEERIADVLENKRALADAVVGTGETWLTELGDDDLRALVSLSAGDVEDDLAERAA